jgi:murein L,D-transpeptidase YafK
MGKATKQRPMFARVSIRNWGLIFIVLFAPLVFLLWAHWPEVPVDARYPVTEVVILKAERELILYSGTRPLKAYKVALGGNPVGQKEFEGDGKTPEGEYVISGRNPKSQCHLALHISYPNAEQAARAKERGTNAGEDIMIHGIKNGFGWIGKGHAIVDWTNGCVAVTNEEIEEIYRSVPDGTKVLIKAN